MYSCLYLDYLNLCWLFKGHHLIQPDSLYRYCLCFSLASLKSDSFSNWNQSIVPCLVLTVASWPVYRFLTRQVRWFGIPIYWRIFQFVVIHTVKGFSIVKEADVFFWNSLAFLMLQQMLAIWSLVPLPFLKPAWTSIWKFTVHVLLKPGLENFELVKNYFTKLLY